LIEFMLLQKLPGYTRRELEQEPACFINRCLLLISAEQDEERRRAARGHTAGKGRV